MEPNHRHPASLGETCGGFANIRCAVELKCQIKPQDNDRGVVADLAGVCVSIKNAPAPFEGRQPAAENIVNTARLGESCGG